MDLSNQIAETWGRVLSWIPDAIAVIVILIIGYFIAKLLKAIVTGALKRTGLNKRVQEDKEWSMIRRITENPSGLIGSVIYWLVFILVITIAIPILNIPVFNQLIFGFYAYLPNVLAALLILIISTLIAAGIGILTKRIFGDTPTGKVVETIAPTLIMAIAVFMVLVQLQIAIEIVVITYAAIWGALALGFALAFGLGGQNVASKLLEDAYKKGRENAGKIREDVSTAKERAEDEVREVKNRMR